MTDRLKLDKPPLREIDFQVDTIPNNFFGMVAYFNPERNAIVDIYEQKKGRFCDLPAEAIFAHEQKHRDNHKNKLANSRVNLEQYYKLCCHDEISASICDTLVMREIYIKSTPKEREEMIEKYKDEEKYSFYFEAIENKEIDPLNISSKKDFEKEMSFIANGVTDMWMDTYPEAYDETHTLLTSLHFSTNDYKNLVKNDDNYNSAKNYMYTIGGIDFSKYIDNDIVSFNKNIIEADKKIAKMDKRSDVKEAIVQNDTKTVARYVHMDYEKGLSAEQYGKLLQHKSMSNYLNNLFKVDLGGIDPSLLVQNKETAEKYMKIASGLLTLNGNFENLMKDNINEATKKHGSEMIGDDELYSKRLKEMYKIDDFSMLDHITDEKKMDSYIPFEVPTKTEEKGVWDRFKGFFKKDEKNFTKPDEKNPFYYGKPIYDKWSPEKRVSPVQKIEIIDFTQPFLKEQMDNLGKRESFKNSMQLGHSRIQEMRQKLADGHGDKFSILKDTSRANAETLRDLRYAPIRSSGTTTPVKITKEAMERLMADNVKC